MLKFRVEMKTDALKEFEGRQVSVVVNGLSHPSSGLLKKVGDDYILLEQSKGDKIILALNYVASVLIAKEGLNDETGQWKRI